MKSCRSGCSGNFHVPPHAHLKSDSNTLKVPSCGKWIGQTNQSIRWNYGVRNRKNFTGVEAVIGMALEKLPLALKFPVVFVVQDVIGVVKFVEVNHV